MRSRAFSVPALRRRTLVVPAAICSVAAVLLPFRTAHAQSSSVTTAADLVGAIQTANAWTGAGSYTINFQAGVTIQPTAQMIIGLALSNTSGLVVNGNGATIDMSQANGGAGDRAFFIADGTVAFNDLTIANGRAVGGAGVGGAGGGAGLGGGIFVADSAAIPGVPALPTIVTLSGVQFLGNTAVGGAGGSYSNQPADPSFGVQSWSGGGGMGGNGGRGYGGFDTSGGGGGGFGFGANGGNASADGDPGIAGALVVTPQGGGGGGYGGAAGGINGGGGGGGNDGLFQRGAGGGGGVGGAAADGNSGGRGGFGGGGGGGGDDSDNAGDGGFGGGGGSGEDTPGSGGFGGGGGSGVDSASSASAANPGGFAGGAGAAGFTDVFYAFGGGGAGLGGAVFVMHGASLTVGGPSSFAGSTVTGGAGYVMVAGSGTYSSGNGSAYGTDLFVGGDVVLSPGPGQQMVVTSLGGAGNLADPSVAANAADPNANGSLLVNGGGLVTLAGASYLSGPLTVSSGTLALAAGAAEQGATSITVGQNAGDVATLRLGSGATLNLAGFASSDQPVVIAAAAGSTGTVVIGDGPGSSGADIGARVFTGGSGTAAIVFAQEYAAGSASDAVYPFFTTLTGSLGILQAGPGTTLLQPLYGANTFSGAVVVESGTLATTGSTAALAGVGGIAVGTGGGCLALGQTEGIADDATLSLFGGTLRTTTGLVETLGPLSVTGDSVIDFLGNPVTLEFATLTLGGRLAIWNYSLPADFLRIASGTVAGSLSQISFYADAGVTYLGEATFSDGYYLVPWSGAPDPVPEIGLDGLGGAAALVAGLCGLIERRRRRA